MITIESMIAKRKRIWEAKGDIEYDTQYVRAAVIKVLETDELRREIVKRPYLLIELAFVIVDKKKKTVPFFLNEVQRDFQDFYEAHGHSKPYMVLKGRQQGFTSYITAMQLSFAIVRRNFSGMTLADKSENSIAIFNDKARMVYERLPPELRPNERFSSKKELFFDKLNSSWRIATATSAVGRSRTLNFIHYSEVAFFACSLAELQSGIGEAATQDAFRVYESTANGFNEAKDLWDSGSCYNLFYEWWRTSEYRSTEYEYLNTDDPWLIERIKLLEEKGLDREQITWYCKKYAGYLDKQIIKQEYPCTPEEAFISSGYGMFDKEKLANQMIRISTKPAPRLGKFVYRTVGTPILGSDGKQVDTEWKITDIEFVECRDGFIRIHEEPQVKRDVHGSVQARAPYVLGGDTAGEGGGEDFFTAKVICNMDGRTVATLHKQHIDEDLYAEQLYCLGKYYHDALIGVETNYSTYPTRVLHRKYNYPNLYMREKLHGLVDKTEMAYGFETNRATKPPIILELVAKMRENPQIEVDRDTLKELMVFVRKDHGVMEAIEGYHDDLVMALAIAHFISRKQKTTWMDVPFEEDHFLRDNFGYVEPVASNSGYVNWEEY